MSTQWQYMGRYATELFSNKSLEVIEKHNTEEPLFLMVAHLAAHTGGDGVELGVPNITRTNEAYDYIKLEQRRRYAGKTSVQFKHFKALLYKKLTNLTQLE